MRYIDLKEGVLSTALVHTIARHALKDDIDNHVKDLVRHFRGEVNLSTESNDDQYHAYSNFFKEEGKSPALAMFCSKISDTLQKAAEDAAKQQIEPLIAGKSEADVGKLYRRLKRGISVVVEVRETSFDIRKKNSGYFNSDPSLDSPLIKCFIPSKKVLDVLLDALRKQFRLKQYDDSAEEIMKSIGATFVHEYVHYIQWMLNTAKVPMDFGYITVGQPKPEKGRKGLRGGYHRDPDGGTASYLRYKGATHEIGAFAATAAASLIQTIRRDERDWNWTVNSLIYGLKDNTSDPSIAGYRRLLKSSLDGSFKKEGIVLKPEQMMKVWKRFIKLVYQFLEKYLRDQAGKADSVGSERIIKRNPDWVTLARKRPRAWVFAVLANKVSQDLMNNTTFFASDEQQMINVQNGTSGSLQHEAEDFIEEYYFGGWSGDEELMQKNIAVFRRMVANRLALTREQKAAA